MDAAGATGDGDIESIVDEQPRTCTARDRNRVGHECGKRSSLEIPFTNLNDVDPRFDRVRDLLKEATTYMSRVGAAAQTTPIGDEMKDQQRDLCVWASGERRRFRRIVSGNADGVRIAHREQRDELRKSCDQVHDAKSAHGATDEVVRDDRPQERPDRGKIIAFPEARPRQHDEQQSDFQEKCDVKQAADQDGIPLATRLRRSIRSGISR